ncbi:Helix-turn-helix domain-containing protein [Glycomyces sambucus]|uniref:Helix-turn-helix domain-containing protein n=2 Tax=Glycomyces sambucus TaxID=380244 RepID=A0A1G9N4V3_9ACTN|nr:Helix-turn-helix domain-containing protein [Glycomyces sambucus]
MTSEVMAGRRGRGYGCAMNVQTLPAFGGLLREWRERRRLSQFDLSVQTGVSARHLSRIETGRAEPSRRMVLRLAEALDVPLRERNALLVAAGFAPAWAETDYWDERLAVAREAIGWILEHHDPLPAVVVDRFGNLLDFNGGAGVLMEGVDPELLSGRVNLARVALHPRGMAPRLRNFGEVRQYFLDRLRAQLAVDDHPAVTELIEEVLAYEPVAPDDGGWDGASPSPIALPLRVRSRHGDLSMFTTIATFGAPRDVTVSELAVELFFPLDDTTRRAFAAAAGGGGTEPIGAAEAARTGREGD